MDISPLIKRLVEIQRELDASDRQFAAKLGVDWSFWSYARKGERAAGRKLIEGACRAFPEVRVFVGQVWLDRHETESEAPRSTEAVAS